MRNKNNLLKTIDSKTASQKLEISISSIFKLRMAKILKCYPNTKLITLSSFNKFKEIVDNYRKENGESAIIPIQSFIKMLKDKE